MKEMGVQLVHSIYGKTEQSAIGRVAEYGARVDTEWQCSSEPTACSGHHQIRVTRPKQTMLLQAGYGYG